MRFSFWPGRCGASPLSVILEEGEVVLCWRYALCRRDGAGRSVVGSGLLSGAPAVSVAAAAAGPVCL